MAKLLDNVVPKDGVVTYVSFNLTPIHIVRYGSGTKEYVIEPNRKCNHRLRGPQVKDRWK